MDRASCSARVRELAGALLESRHSPSGNRPGMGQESSSEGSGRSQMDLGIVKVRGEDRSASNAVPSMDIGLLERVSGDGCGAGVEWKGEELLFENVLFLKWLERRDMCDDPFCLGSGGAS